MKLILVQELIVMENIRSTKYVHDIRDKYESEVDRLDVLDENIKAFDVDTTLHLSGTISYFNG